MADPYRFFRIEAWELVDKLDQGFIALERGENGPLVQELLRLAHTLKGAARVVRRPEVAELAHALEEDLLGVQEGKAAPIEALVRGLGAIRRHLRELDEPESPAPSPRPTAVSSSSEAVRVEVGSLDHLLEELDEARIGLRGLEALRVDLGSAVIRARDLAAQLRDEVPSELQDRAAALAGDLTAADRSLEDHLDRVRRELSHAHDHLRSLRLVPVADLFTALERAAMDAARPLGVRLRFQATGRDVRLDRSLLSGVLDALLHLVQNAVVHGLEPPAVREAAGKAPEGLLSVRASHEGSLVALVVRDDGRGLDPEALRQAAIASGMVGEEEARHLPTDEIAQLVWQPGVTTASELQEAAGRGLGLETVQAIARRLGGTVHLDHGEEPGLTVTLRVPATASLLQLLRVKAGHREASLPLHAVVGVASSSTASHGALPWKDRDVPYHLLAPLLGAASPAPPTAVVVRRGTGLLALGVDALLGVTEAVVRSLPDLAGACPGVLGGWVDTHGEAELVLEPTTLPLDAKPVLPPLAAPPPHPILIVDDSLTTRMLEQSILETAGYRVALARSGEEAMEMARSSRYGLYVVDVEMPGMDGLEFVRRTRADPVLAGTPAILVTSRGRPEDRQAGLEAGASAYIDKAEFDQEHFLDRVRELAGSP